MPNFEVLDALIASALNRIIHNSHFQTFPSWKTDCLLDLRTLPGTRKPTIGRELCRPIYGNDEMHSNGSKWDGLFLDDENPT